MADWLLQAEPRLFQREDSDAIVNALDAGAIPILNEPPGFGKTFVVINALLNRMSVEDVVVVIVPTKKLAEYWGSQIEKSGANLTYATVIGKRNFKCILADDARADDPRIVCNRQDPVVVKLKNCPYYAPTISKSTFDLYLDSRDVMMTKEYTSLFGQRYVVFTRPKGTCPYYLQYYEMADKHVIITTVHMATVLAMRGILPKPTFVVIDEVDEVPFALLRNIDITKEVVDYVLENARKYLDEENKKKLYENRYKAHVILENTEMPPSKKLYEITNLLLPYIRLILRNYFDDDIMQLYMALTSSNVKDVRHRPEESLLSVVVDTSPFIYDIIRNTRYTILVTGSPLDVPNTETLLRYLGISGEYRVVASVPYIGKAIYVVGDGFEPITKHNFEISKQQICKYYRELAHKLLEYSEKMFGIRKLFVPVIAYRYIYDCKLNEEFPGSLDKENPNAIDEFVRGNREVLISSVASRGLSFTKGSVLIMKKPWPDVTSASVKYIVSQPYGREYLELFTTAQVLQIVSRFLRSPDSEVIVGTKDKRVLESLLVYRRRGGYVYMLNGEKKLIDDVLFETTPSSQNGNVSEKN